MKFNNNGTVLQLCPICNKEFLKYKYINSKIKNYEICSDCFYEGKYPINMQSGNFIRVMNKAYKKKSSEEVEWTDQETLLLIEGLDMYDDDWLKIADHVKTKTREQCILKFLQLPIEDPYLGIPQSELGGLQYQTEENLPLGETDNPIMSIVAFLTSVVNPGVASAAANAALNELGKEMNSEELKKTKSSKSLSHTLQKKEIKDITKSIDQATAEKDKIASNNDNDNNNNKNNQDKEVNIEKDKNLASESKENLNINKINNENQDQKLANTENNNVDEKEKEKSNLNLSSNQSKDEVVSNTSIKQAAAAALAAAAAKSKVLATYEEREIRHLVNELIEIQLKKIEMKMNQFDKLESVLEAEKMELMKQQQNLYVEQVALKQQLLAMKSGSSQIPPKLIAVSRDELDSSKNQIMKMEIVNSKNDPSNKNDQKIILNFG